MNRNRKTIRCMVGSLVLLATFLFQPSISAAPSVRIAFVLDGPSEHNARAVKIFQDEIRVLLADDFDVEFPPDKVALADFTTIGVGEANDRLLADPEIDILITLGVLASMDAARRTELSIPVIAPLVLGSQIQGVPGRNGTSGIRNLSYLESPFALERELAVFGEIAKFNRLAFLGNRSILEEIPGVAANIREAIAGAGYEPFIVPVSGSAADLLNQLPEEVEAVYMAPLLELDPGQFDELIAGLNERRLPTFSYMGRTDVERGVLAGLASASWLPHYARRTALNVQRILLGEDAGTLPTAIARREELVLNMATARAISLSPDFKILTEAVLLQPARTEVARRITLPGAATDAVQANLDLLAARSAVEAGSHQSGVARAGLLPQIDLWGLGNLIDQDRAEAGFGSVAEKTVSGGVDLRQVLWSEETWSALSIQNSLQIGREQQLHSLRLDIAQAAATTYIDLIRVKTIEQIQKDNLKLSRSNLELAQVRDALGVSGPAEVYRWQGRIAEDRKSAIEANSRRNLAEIALNQILHRPLEEPFLAEPVDLANAGLITSDPEFLKYFGDKFNFRRLRAFLVDEGLSASPELAQLDAAIEAQDRALRSARRSFYSPTLALQGGMAHRFSESGAGSEGGALELPGVGAIEFPQADDTDWNVALSLSIPLSRGGGRLSEIWGVKAELSRLQLERQAVAERIEQRVRSVAHIAGASYAAIALSGAAAEAAAKNLELVLDAYSRGAVRIIDLLDAQNASLNAEQVAANSVYQFLIDLLEIERSVGCITYLSSGQECQDWRERLADHFGKAENEQ